MIKTKDRPFMTIPEAAREFHFPAATIKTLIRQNTFPVMKVGSRVYIMRDVFADFVRKGGGCYDDHYKSSDE